MKIAIFCSLIVSYPLKTPCSKKVVRVPERQCICKTRQPGQNCVAKGALAREAGHHAAQDVSQPPQLLAVRLHFATRMHEVVFRTSAQEITGHKI